MPETTTHLYRAIHAQPQAIRDLLADQAPVSSMAQPLANCQRFLLVGIGTSFHAATVGAYVFRALGIEAWAVQAFEFVTYHFPLHASDAVVLISHRGNKQYSNQVAHYAQEAGATVISVHGRHPKAPVTTPFEIETVEQDPSSTHTISYMAALTRLVQLATTVARSRGQNEGARQFEQGLTLIPAAIEDILQREQAIQAIAHEVVAQQQRLYYTGTGPNAATAWEGALKAKEAAYVTAEGSELEQAIHGPLVALDKNDLIVMIAPPGASMKRTADFLQALGEIGSSLWLIGEVPGAKTQAFSQQHNWQQFTLNTQTIPEVLTPLLTVVPLQLLADFLASERGTDADGFRLEQANYKQALSHITL